VPTLDETLMNHPASTRRLRTFALVLCLGLALVACRKDKPQTSQAAASDPMLVQAPAELIAQLQVSAVEEKQVSDTLRVAGTIDFDELALTRIGATVTGRVTQLLVQQGQNVKTGDALAQIHSSELSAAQLAYIKSRSQAELFKRNVQRAQTLFEADVVSAAELQRRQNEYDVAAAETRAALDQLRVLGMSPKSIDRLSQTGAIDSNAWVSATLSGVVVERKVAAGQVVQPSDAMFVVANLQRVWAVAQVPEQQVSQVKVGQSVMIEVPALDNEKLVGKLIYVGQTVNPDTRTVLVRTELDNRDGRLKPAMLASMLIQANPEKRLAIPAAAVVREDDEDHVFVELQQTGQFKLTPVKLSAEHDGHRLVQEGLKSGMRIVTDGAFHLNNHRNMVAMGDKD
jgi:cobalt-zinc-cadmium efflux system membrane fusion protein